MGGGGVRALMKSLAGSPAAVLLLASTPVSAKDYRLDYGIETRAGGDAGSIVCAYERCVVKIEQLHLTLSIYVSRGYTDRERVELEGEPACCFFDGGAQTQNIVTGNP